MLHAAFILSQVYTMNLWDISNLHHLFAFVSFVTSFQLPVLLGFVFL